MSAFEQLATYLSYPFVVNALVVGVLVALCSSLLGTTLVMKRRPTSATGFRTWLLAPMPLRRWWG